MRFFQNIRLFSFLRKRGQPPEKPVDDPSLKEPREVTGTILHPPAPTGTRFNRKMLMILASIAGLVMIFTFMAALQPPKKLTPLEEAEASAKKAQATTNYAPTPEEISTAPDTYAGLRNFQEAQQIKRGDIPGKGTIPGEGVGSVKAISPASINAYNAQAGGNIPQLSEADKERMDARKSPIRFLNASSTVPQAASLPPIPAVAPAPATIPQMPWQKEDDQNMQTEKREFVENERKAKDVYVKGRLISPLSKYEVKAGSIIPGVMITGINSDLPGKLTGQVRENVYDTVTGKYLLIPQGTRVIGTYDSKIAYAQDRVLIVWTRIIFPNGDSIDLEGMDGVDLSGYAGMKDKVNNHYGKLITGVILSSMLSAGAKVAAGNNDVGTATFPQQAASGAAEQVAMVGARFADRNLNVQPTIEIRPGMKFNVFVNKDLILKHYRT
ncbi:MAG: Type IV secretion system protein PtlG [Syntrophorhabdus sp. PtaU1.Bin050]|nr:MAG: Type IV secretion system protein PtlG [Syntrophorhabdus sp. PtaU1.Bin050]